MNRLTEKSRKSHNLAVVFFFQAETLLQSPSERASALLILETMTSSGASGVSPNHREVETEGETEALPRPLSTLPHARLL